MNAIKFHTIIVIGVLAWFLPGWALEQANRLEQEATGGVPGRVVPRPGFEQVAISQKKAVERPQPREIDDVEIPDIIRVPNPEGGPDRHVPALAENRSKQKYAGIWRHVSTVTQDRWWYLPVGLVVLLVLSETTNLLKRRVEEVPEPEAIATEPEPPEKLDIEALLIELEKLRQEKPGKEVAVEKPIVGS